MKKAYVMIIAILLAAALFSACSGGGAVNPENKGTDKTEAPADVSKEVAVEASTAPEAGAIIEPEQLISKEDAAAFVGEVKEGKKTEQAVVGQKIMFYETTDGEGLLQISLTQQAFMSTDNNTPESIYMITKDAMSDMAYDETAQGIGDEYFFGIPGLHILYKGYYICLDAGRSDDPAVREVLKQVGAKAIANLDALLG